MMKKLFLALLVLVALFGITTLEQWFLMTPTVRAQTNTFCAANLACTVTGTWTFSNSLTVSGGTATVKILQATNFYADQYCAGSLDVGLCINNTLAAMPTASGYKAGTIRLDGFAPGSAWVWNTLVTISSPYVSIIGPSSAALQITASVLTGDHLRINTSPFIVSLAGQFGGFALVGGAQANAVCVHVGDIIGAKFSDLRCSNFTGTGAVGLWEDNVTNFTERTMLDKVHLDGCTKGIRFTNTGNVAGTASFGHQRWYSVWINVGANQTGISYESGTLYSGTFNITENLNATTSTGVAISGLAYAAGPSTAWTGSLVNLNAETSAGSGTLFNTAAGSSVLIGGVVTTGGGLTNTGTGTLNIYPGNAITNADYSNSTFAAGVLVIGGSPQATNIPQFNANSASAIAGVTASNYYLLRAGVAGLEAHDTSGDVGIAGFHSAVSGYRCAVAGACDFGTAAIPVGNLWLGTALTNNFKVQPAATGQATAMSLLDPKAATVAVSWQGGIPCTNGELVLSAGWGTTATVTAVAGLGWSCEWTVTSSGTGQAANPTLTDTLVLPVLSASVACEMRMVGGSGTATLIDQTTLSATAPIFTFLGTPVAASTYKVYRRC